jgi:hypothetical protein
MADAGGHPTFTPKINPDDHSAKVVLCGALLLPPVTMMTILSIYNRVRSKTLLQIDSLVTLVGIVCYATATSHHAYITLTVRLPDPSHRNLCNICPRDESRFREALDDSNGPAA